MTQDDISKDADLDQMWDRFRGFFGLRPVGEAKVGLTTVSTSKRVTGSALALRAGGMALLLCAFAGYFGSRVIENVILAYVVGGTAGACGTIGIWCLNRARQHLAITAQNALANDARPPVIYLRPFSEDSKAAGVLGGWLTLQTRTEEEQLARTVYPVGPLVAIGDPNDSLPTLGAARLYTGDATWQATLLELLQRARLVILRAGTTSAFMWELETVLRLRAPETVVILIAGTKSEYDAFRAHADRHLSKNLPDYSPGKVRLGTIGGLVLFRHDWTPVLVQAARESTFRGSRAFAMAASLNLMFRPVFEQIGLPWRRAPVSWPRTLVVLAALVGPCILILVVSFQ